MIYKKYQTEIASTHTLIEAFITTFVDVNE